MSDNWADSVIARLQQQNPAAVRLAELACLAVQVDAPLLRRLRRQFLPESDPGTEADLWFSPLMASQDSDGCVLHHAVALRLRARLLKERASLIGPATEAMRAAHLHLPAAMRLEEDLTVLALEDTAASAVKVEQALQPALRTIGGADAGSALEIARWAMQALPRMPDHVRSAPAAQTLRIAAAMRLEEPRIAAGMEDSTIGVETLAWLVPPETLDERTTLGVSLFGNGIGFAVAEGAEHVIDLPKTNPALVSLRWTIGGTEHRRLEAAAPGRFVEILGNPDEIRIVTLAGTAYSLSRSDSSPPASQHEAAVPQEAVDEHRESCVLVENLGGTSRPTIAFPVGDGLWIAASRNIGSTPFVGVVGGATMDQFKVVNADESQSELSVLEPLLEKQQPPLPMADEDPSATGLIAVIGFESDRPASFSARFHGERHQIVIDGPASHSTTFLGAPVIQAGRVVGVIVQALRIQPTRMGETLVDADEVVPGDRLQSGDVGAFRMERADRVWRLAPVTAITDAVRAAMAAQQNAQRPTGDGGEDACIRLGIVTDGGPTAFGVTPGWLVTNAHPFTGIPYPDDRLGGEARFGVVNEQRSKLARSNLSRLKKRYEVVHGEETKGGEFLVLRSSKGSMPRRLFLLMARDDPAFSSISSRGMPVTVFGYDGRRFQPARGQARLNELGWPAVSIDGDDALHGPHDEWRRKFAGAPVVVDGKVLGMVVAREHWSTTPVLRLVESWRIHEAIQQSPGAFRAPVPQTTDTKTPVYISHDARDRQLAEEIAEALAEAGLSPHVEATLDGIVGPAIQAAISRSTAVIALATAAAVSSKWLEQERAVARRLGKRILPIVMAGGFAFLPKDLQKLQAFDLRADRSNLRDLVAQVEGLVRQESPAKRPNPERVNRSRPSKTYTDGARGKRAQPFIGETMHDVADMPRKDRSRRTSAQKKKKHKK